MSPLKNLLEFVKCCITEEIWCEKQFFSTLESAGCINCVNGSGFTACQRTCDLAVADFRCKRVKPDLRID